MLSQNQPRLGLDGLHGGGVISNFGLKVKFKRGKHNEQ
jgi:hypothetical protein